jgi:hypothetical protein
MGFRYQTSEMEASMTALVELFVAFVFSFGESVAANMVEAVTSGVSGSVLVMAACGFISPGL